MIERSVLVLNKSWIAVNLASVKRAITLVYRRMARVVSPQDYSTYTFEDWLNVDGNGEHSYVRSVNLRFRVPEVIVLTMFGGIPRKDMVLTRKAIFERDNNTCQYCGRKSRREKLTIDHVIPRSRGGGDTWDNLVLACLECNARKRNKGPEEVGMKLQRRPAKPRWLPHMGLSISVLKKPEWRRFVDANYWESESQWTADLTVEGVR
jgi:5-methylcytosine-specific restriction endonuclease McrA